MHYDVRGLVTDITSRGSPHSTMATFTFNKSGSPGLKIAVMFLLIGVFLVATANALPTDTASIQARDAEECVGLCQHYRNCTIGLSIALGLSGFVVIAAYVGVWCCYACAAMCWDS